MRVIATFTSAGAPSSQPHNPLVRRFPHPRSSLLVLVVVSSQLLGLSEALTLTMGTFCRWRRNNAVAHRTSRWWLYESLSYTMGCCCASTRYI
jgi:hypothetical protein